MKQLRRRLMRSLNPWAFTHKKRARLEHSDRVTVAEKFRYHGSHRPYVRCNNGQVRRVYVDDYTPTKEQALNGVPFGRAFVFLNCGEMHLVSKL